jgi:glucan phosphoethanolaminetransferase (alkaline phosphatase superfamily)
MKNYKNFLLSFLLLSILLITIQSIYHPLFLWEELNFHFELFDLRGIAKGSIFLATYLLAILSILILIGLRSSKLFGLFLLISYLFLSIDFFVQFLGVSHGFSLDEYALSMNELGNYKYLQAYLDTILKSMLLASMVVALFYLIRKKLCKKRFSNQYLGVVLLFVGIIYAACYKVDTYKLSTYPASIKVPAIALDYTIKSKPLIKRQLNEQIKPSKKEQFQNIVWIIDESVVGSFLSLNGYDKKTTPYLDELNQKSQKIFNFGVANSISNCSAESNLFLRIGLNPKKEFNVEEEMYTLPTIFQYAKRAGYTTWFMDSQTRENHLQNYLTLYDKESMDHFKTLGPNVKRIDRDKKFLDEMITIINSKNKTKNFIVLVKYGAHFPYLLTYDHNYSPFQPVMDVSYGGMDMEHKEQQMNTYLNALYYNTDLYLKELVTKANLKNSIIFYTSDHGQNILESPNLTRPHCNSERVVKHEVSVPLMVFQEHAKELFEKDRKLFYSQIQLFPTTLALFGYSNKRVERYGKTLFDGYKSSEEREYILSSSGEKRVYK